MRRDHGRANSRLGFLERFEEDVPAFAVREGSAGQCDREGNLERRDLPALAGSPALHQDPERLEKGFRRLVLAMLVLDAFKDGDLAPRAQVHFKETDAVDDVIVDALGIAAGLIQARLPAALENIARIAAVRDPLRLGGAWCQKR